MAMRIPVIASPEALQGLQADPGTHALRPANPTEWCDSLGALFSDVKARARLGLNGRAFVERNHGWTVCLKPLEESFGQPKLSTSSERACIDTIESWTGTSSATPKEFLEQATK
jgi:hypothetical protein